METESRVVACQGRGGRDGRGRCLTGQRFSPTDENVLRICHSYVNKVNATEKQDTWKRLRCQILWACSPQFLKSYLFYFEICLALDFRSDGKNFRIKNKLNKSFKISPEYQLSVA